MPPYWTHAACHLERVDQLRPGQHPRPALQRRQSQVGPVQPDRLAQQRPDPHEEDQCGERRGRARRGHRQGLRAVQGQLRAALRGRAGRPRPRVPTHDRHRGVRRPGRHRPGLLRRLVPPVAGPGHGEGLRPAGSHHGAGGQGRHLPLRDAPEAVPGRHPPCRRPPGPLHPGVRGRGQRGRRGPGAGQGQRGRRLRQGAGDGRAAGRLAGRHLGAREVQRHLPGTGHGDDRGQGGGRHRLRRGHRGPAPGEGRGPHGGAGGQRQGRQGGPRPASHLR